MSGLKTARYSTSFVASFLVSAPFDASDGLGLKHRGHQPASTDRAVVVVGFTMAHRRRSATASSSDHKHTERTLRERSAKLRRGVELYHAARHIYTLN